MPIDTLQRLTFSQITTQPGLATVHADPSEAIRDHVAGILGWTPQHWRPAIGGYTPTARYLVTNAVRSAFVKVATTPLTAKMLKREIEVYAKLSGPFMAQLYGYHIEDEAPLLVIEDLSGATWPPPWNAKSVDLVLEQITAMHGTIADLKPRNLHHEAANAGWQAVAANPQPFLSLGLASPEWLAYALPALLAAEVACELDGEAVTHLDLRSDNICFAPTGVKIIDWAEAGRSNPQVDLGFWLPSLNYEGGPAPEHILPRAPEIAAQISGFFAGRAGLPEIPDAPSVRRVQREQLSTALPWVQRALGLKSF
jgi:thiamine kinase-like enzyme